MYIVIAGGGIVGKTIVKELSKQHDVVVIESNYEYCQDISAKYGAVAIHGDATSIQTLKEAGIESCDYALGVMDDDTQNLLFALLCKNFKIKNIFVRMRNPEYREAYELAGATNIGNSVQMMANKFVLDIENPNMRRVASLSKGKADVTIVSLEENFKYKGKTIADITSLAGFPTDVVIAGVFDTETDEFIVPRGNTQITNHNQLFIVGKRDSVKKAYQILNT
jgi:trk system potassium uptake protein TrkA